MRSPRPDARLRRACDHH